jgi:hypothetical protein
MTMAGIDYRALRGDADMAAVLHLLGFVPRQRRGDQVRGPCPLHKLTSPASRSFSAHLTKQAYRCFQCGSSGNQLDLWAAATAQPLYQAAIALCEQLHRPVPWLPRAPAAQENPRPPVDTDRGSILATLDEPGDHAWRGLLDAAQHAPYSIGNELHHPATCLRIGKDYQQ